MVGDDEGGVTPCEQEPPAGAGVLARQVVSVADAGLRGVAAGVGAVRAGGVEPSDCGQVGAGQIDAVQVGAGQIDAVQVGTRQVGTGQDRIGQVDGGADQVAQSKTATAAGCRHRARNATRGDAGQGGLGQDGPGHSGARKDGARQDGAGHIDIRQVGIRKVDIREVGAGQVGTSNGCIEEIGSSHVQSLPLNLSEIAGRVDRVGTRECLAVHRRRTDRSSRTSRADGTSPPVAPVAPAIPGDPAGPCESHEMTREEDGHVGDTVPTSDSAPLDDRQP